MIIEAKAALVSFLASALWAIIKIAYDHDHPAKYAYFGGLILFQICVFLLLFWGQFSVVWRAYFIGLIFAAGVSVALYGSPAWTAFGLYMSVVGFFHISEYLATALFNPSTVRLESFLLNHSLAYNIAHALCIIEYIIWWRVYPGIKLHPAVQIAGLTLCMMGEFLRKLAMYTAGISFNHIIQYEKHEEHVLVTNGIYALCRHPSYAGWFCWSVATQILASNPVCFVGYCIVSWKFFNERIYEEEQLLINFFRNDYLKYQNKVPSGVPFVKGFRLKYRPKYR